MLCLPQHVQHHCQVVSSVCEQLMLQLIRRLLQRLFCMWVLYCTALHLPPWAAGVRALLPCAGCYLQRCCDNFATMPLCFILSHSVKLH